MQISFKSNFAGYKFIMDGPNGLSPMRKPVSFDRGKLYPVETVILADDRAEVYFYDGVVFCKNEEFELVQVEQERLVHANLDSNPSRKIEDIGQPPVNYVEADDAGKIHFFKNHKPVTEDEFIGKEVHQRPIAKGKDLGPRPKKKRGYLESMFNSDEE